MSECGWDCRELPVLPSVHHHHSSDLCRGIEITRAGQQRSGKFFVLFSPRGKRWQRQWKLLVIYFYCLFISLSLLAFHCLWCLRSSTCPHKQLWQGPPFPMDTRTSQLSRALLPCNSSSLSPSQGESTPARAPCLQWNKYSTAPAACLGAVIPGSFPTTPTGAFLAFLAPHTRAPQRIMLLLVQAMIPSFWVSRTAILQGRREF